MRKDCPCQETNENCYRCDGKGYYDEEDLKPLTRIPFNKKLAKTSLNKKLVCHYCGEEFYAIQLDSHILKVHGIIKDKSPKQKIAIVKNKTYLVKCPHCNSKVRNDRLARHINNVHKNLPNTTIVHKISQLKKPLMVNNSIIVNCPQCNSKVRKDLLHNHIKKFHNKSLTNKTNKVSKIEKKEKASFPKKSYAPKDIDGSKGWHIYRDEGKFGSFPSFDPMDDKSFPD